MTFSMASPLKDKSDRVCVPLEGIITRRAKEDSKIFCFCKSIDEYKLAVVLNL
jgi:3-dehydroquinate synthase class II